METKVSFPTPATATNTASNTIARIDQRLNVIYFAPSSSVKSETEECNLVPVKYSDSLSLSLSLLSYPS